MNPFTLIPAGVRRIIYIAYGSATLALTMATAGYASVDQAVPSWLNAAGAALVPLGAALAAVAASNTNASVSIKDEDSFSGEVAAPDSGLPTGAPTKTVLADPLDAPAQGYDGHGAPITDTNQED